MKLPLILGLGLALATSAAIAQQQAPNPGSRPKKHTHDSAMGKDDKAKSASPATQPKATSPAAETAKNLRRLEQQTTKMSSKSTAAGKKHTPASAPLLKQQPAHASASGAMGTAKGAAVSQPKNPYRGRLRQKAPH
jgi:hypothetical protein